MASSAPRSVLGPLLACLLAASCGDGAADPGAPELLWESPDLPWPWAVEIGGRAVDEELLRGFLEGEWADFAAAESVTAETAMASLDAFCAEPEARFGALVGDVLLLWEGERRFPALGMVELDEFRRRMEAATGGAMEALRRRLGEDGLQRHVERRFRLERTLDALAGELGEPTEAELMADYHRAVEGIEVAEGAAGPTFEQWEPRLRASWRKERWYQAGRDWIAAARRGVAAEVTRPDGRILVVPAP